MSTNDIKSNHSVEEYEIEIKNLTKSFETKDGDLTVIKNLNLNIKKNEFIVVVGPSGCGKTTLMNIIAGLYDMTDGILKVDGKEVNGPGKGKGVVFQQYALFPWLTVRKNVEFGLKMKRVRRSKRRAISDKYITLVGLDKFADSYPKTLSGGMKQRVAIARAYATNPSVLLMDEPFGALDAQTRAQLQENLMHTWQTEKKTCFFITHDVEEAVLLATRVVIMGGKQGEIKNIVDINLPYPRNQETKLLDEFNDLKNHIWNTVYKDYLEVNY